MLITSDHHFRTFRGHKNAIWFNKEAKMWQLGKLESIGRNCCFIHAACNASELHKVTSWKYTKCGDWVFAPTNDLQVRGT